MKDKLLGPVDITARTQYQVLCPMFDTTQEEGNFIGAPVERKAITPEGKVWVLNIVKLQNYFLAKDYGFQDIDYTKNNWAQLLSKSIPELAGVNPVELIERLVVQVNLAQPTGTRPNPRIYLVQVSMTRSQITPANGRDAAQGSTAFPVFPTPGLLESRERHIPVLNGVMTTQRSRTVRLQKDD